MPLDIKKLVKISKALADENRYRIFKMIADHGEISCKEITDAFSLSQPTISHHLKVLAEGELVAFRKEGQWSYFYVNKNVLRDYLASLNEKIVNE
ncbi:MAG: metalloregulator ArsR/SmtB family transcription factor [candidate division KSB1 bacterium]|nr:metalloregulator ArsR/SmtB family transcription factor [candidate division KSB1 bacterium]MDQ7063990.1 metalloregulator ArsR/SmtB family transcription factor [candidate division KSB1 bacterium]